MTQSQWYTNEEFWNLFMPAAFTEAKWAAAVKEADSLLNMLQIAPGSHILDLCCGPGRYLLELAKRGYAVTGVDSTKSYLDLASKNAKERGLSIELIHADMRDFSMVDTFDGVLNIGLSFGYFEDEADDLKVVQNVYRSLKMSSRFVIDVASIEWPRSLGNWYIVEHDQLHAFVQQHLAQDGRWLEADWTIRSSDGDHHFTFAQRLYSEDTLYSLLQSGGFRNIQLYSDLMCNQVDSSARRIVAVAEK